MNLVGIVSEEDIAAVIGERLSDAGSSRIVHTVAGDDGWVVKQSRNAPHSANRTEWEVWRDWSAARFPGYSPNAARYPRGAAIS